LPGARQEPRQNVEWLFLKADFKTVPPQFPGFKVDFKDTALNSSRRPDVKMFLFHKYDLLSSLDRVAKPAVAFALIL
jgi:hypothetical protein